jgi:hypothetical protein
MQSIDSACRSKVNPQALSDFRYIFTTDLLPAHEATDSEKFLNASWHALEPEGVWSRGDNAAIIFQHFHQIGNCPEMEICFKPLYLNPDSPFNVYFKVNGVEVFHVDNSCNEFLSVKFPLCSGDHAINQFVIDVLTPDSFSPNILDIPDMRKLGIFLRSFTIVSEGK